MNVLAIVASRADRFREAPFVSQNLRWLNLVPSSSPVYPSKSMPKYVEPHKLLTRTLWEFITQFYDKALVTMRKEQKTTLVAKAREAFGQAKPSLDDSIANSQGTWGIHLDHYSWQSSKNMQIEPQFSEIRRSHLQAKKSSLSGSKAWWSLEGTLFDEKERRLFTQGGLISSPTKMKPHLRHYLPHYLRLV